MTDKLIVGKKGEDWHKTFSVRIREETVMRLDHLALATERSRNELINLLLVYALDHVESPDYLMENHPTQEAGTHT